MLLKEVQGPTVLERKNNTTKMPDTKVNLHFKNVHLNSHCLVCALTQCRGRILCFDESRKPVRLDTCCLCYFHSGAAS